MEEFEFIALFILIPEMSKLFFPLKTVCKMSLRLLWTKSPVKHWWWIQWGFSWEAQRTTQETGSGTKSEVTFPQITGFTALSLLQALTAFCIMWEFCPGVVENTGKWGGRLEQGLRRTESTALCVKKQKGKIPFFDRRLLQATPRKNINSGNQFSLQLSPLHPARKRRWAMWLHVGTGQGAVLGTLLLPVVCGRGPLLK